MALGGSWLSPQTGVPSASRDVATNPPLKNPQETPWSFSRFPMLRPVKWMFSAEDGQSSYVGSTFPI